MRVRGAMDWRLALKLIMVHSWRHNKLQKVRRIDVVDVLKSCRLVKRRDSSYMLHFLCGDGIAVILVSLDCN